MKPATPRSPQPRHLEWQGIGPWGRHRLHALDWGSRHNRRVIVCVHGYSGNARSFDFLARRLARHARVICPDIAGRGESARLPTAFGYNPVQLLADLRGLLAQIGAESVEWVGTSMGGLLGLMLASERASPIRRLVLNDIGAFVPADALLELGRSTLSAPGSFATLDALGAHVRHTHRESSPMTEEHWAHLIRHSGRELPDGRYELHYDPALMRVTEFPLVPGLSLWSAWARVRCPVLVVRGARSTILPRDVLEAMLEIKPDTEVAEIANAGHVPALMSDGEIQLIEDFLGRTKSGFQVKFRARAVTRTGDGTPLK